MRFLYGYIDRIGIDMVEVEQNGGLWLRMEGVQLHIYIFVDK
jgi:hypothetical protein